MIVDLKRLSILIPVYNTDITRLILALTEEIRQAGLNREVSILCLDDASPDKGLREKNLELVKSIANCSIRYLIARKNSGRTGTRNKLIRLAHADWLLFLDSDVQPDRPDFLRTYLNLAEIGNCDVACGGTSYEQRDMMGKEFDFYYNLMKQASLVSVDRKNLDKWRYVLTSNIFARRSVFIECKFDKRFKTYGYEDQEWAIRAIQRFRLEHVDNPVSHLGLQTRKEFFQKMRISIKNYLLIKKIHPHVFAATPLAKVLHLLTAVPDALLKPAEWILANICSCIPLPLNLLYLLYQLDKAVLLAILSNAEERNILAVGH